MVIVEYDGVYTNLGPLAVLGSDGDTSTVTVASLDAEADFQGMPAGGEPAGGLWGSGTSESSADGREYDASFVP